MLSDRSSGILLHLTSLPSYGGIGDLGPAAYGFVDFLVAAKQRLWQVLPLNPTGYGNSPYAATSAFAGSPLLISLEFLVRDGLLEQHQIEGLAGHYGNVDFDRAWREKLPLVHAAAQRFMEIEDAPQKQAFEEFREKNKSWLPDYSRFVLLRAMHGSTCWIDWPEEYCARDEKALAKLDQDHADDLLREQAIQFLFDRQWQALRTYCTQQNVRVMGDVAIFVNYDSADVWSNKDIFELDEKHMPTAVSGVPPDYFSATGQRWGNPLYRWRYLEQHGFSWWVDRVRRQLDLYDLLRLDHFRGFEAYWRIPAEEETAINGAWVEAPGAALFDRLKGELGGELPLVAEDLGVITAKVDALRETFGMPGMRVLQFGFGGRGAHLHLPHKFVPNTVVYTGTHDNNTTLGWWREVGEVDRRAVQTYLGPIAHEHDIVWAMIRCAERSVASLCILPLQDLLHLGSDGRMNTPADANGNWTWRFHPEALHPDLSYQLGRIMEETDRDGYVLPVEDDPTLPHPSEALESQEGEAPV